MPKFFLPTLVFASMLCGCSAPTYNFKEVTLAPLAGEEDPDLYFEYLVYIGDHKNASLFFSDKFEYFDAGWLVSPRDDHDQSIKEVQISLKSYFAKRAKSHNLKVKALDKSVPKEKWPAIKSTFDDAIGILSEFNAHVLLRELDEEELPSDFIELQKEVLAYESRLREQGSAHYKEYDHLAENNFFDVYPLPYEQELFFQANLDSVLTYCDGLAPKNIANFYVKHKDSYPASVLQHISDKYVSRRIEDKNFRSTDVFSINSDLAELGMSPNPVGSIVVLKSWDDRIEIFQDEESLYPRSAYSLQEIANGARPEGVRFAVGFHPSKFNQTFREKNSNTAKGMKVTGHQTVQNPQYFIAQQNALDAQVAFQNFQAQQATTPTTDLGAALVGGFLKGLASGTLKGKLNSAQQTLLQTPQTVEEPIFGEYRYLQKNMDVQERIKGTVVLIDFDKGQFRSASTTLDDSKQLACIKGIDVTDPQRAAVLANKPECLTLISQSKAAVKNLSATELLTSKKYRFSGHKKLTNLSKLLSVSAQSSISAQGKSDTGRTSTKLSTAKDTRFGSVVHIASSKGTGTGFFIRPGLIVSNSHVIGGDKVVAVSNVHGSQTVGEVIKDLPDKDIVFLKTTLKGQAVRRYSGEPIIGSSLSSIGHPQGLRYSLSKGTLSAMRERNGVVMVQTDTAINPGNSGGPLFIGKKVIGMNTGKFSGEGLSFAVYIQEIVDELP